MNKKCKMNKKIQIIKKMLLPQDLQLDIIDIIYSKYKYINKYDIEENNINIIIKVIYKNELFRIIFFHGIGYNSLKCIDKIIIINEKEFQNNNNNNNTLCINMNSVEQLFGITHEGQKVYKLYHTLNNHCFENDNSLYNESPYFLEKIINKLEKVDYFILNLKIKKDNIYLENIKELRKFLQEAKRIYRNNEGKRLLNKILNNKECPQMLKDFCKKYNIIKILFEEHFQNKNTISEYGCYIVLEDELGKERFGFLTTCTEDYQEGISFTHTEFINSDDFVNKIKEEELLVPEDKWTEQMTNEAFDVWKYIITYEKVGFKKELFISK